MKVQAARDPAGTFLWFGRLCLLVLRIGLWDRDELLHAHINKVDLKVDLSLVQIYRQDPADGARGTNVVAAPGG